MKQRTIYHWKSLRMMLKSEMLPKRRIGTEWMISTVDWRRPTSRGHQAIRLLLLWFANSADLFQMHCLSLSVAYLQLNDLWVISWKDTIQNVKPRIARSIAHTSLYLSVIDFQLYRLNALEGVIWSSPTLQVLSTLRQEKSVGTNTKI